MRGSSLVLSMSVVLALLLVMTATAAHALNYTHRPTGLVLPEKLSMFTRGEPRDYDLNYPGTGTGISYNLADIQALIGIYDYRSYGKEITPAAVALEAKRAVAEVYAKIRERYYGGVVPLQDVAPYNVEGGRTVYMAGFTVHASSQTFREYVYITSFKRHYIKLRMIHPNSASDDIVRNMFVRRFIEMLDSQSR